MLGVGVMAELRRKPIISRPWGEFRSGCIVNEGLPIRDAHLSASSILIDAEFERLVLVRTWCDNCIKNDIQDKSLNL